jgi:uncharacterized protein (DUF885 family)
MIFCALWPGQVGAYTNESIFTHHLEIAQVQVSDFDLRSFNTMLISQGEITVKDLWQLVHAWQVRFSRDFI